MRGENLERWRELCALAAAEQDPDRLLALIQEINTLLERKERRLKLRSDLTDLTGDNVSQDPSGLHLCKSNCC